MQLMAEIDLGLDMTLQILRLDGYSQDEITEALNQMPRDVLDNWRDTLQPSPITRKSAQKG